MCGWGGRGVNVRKTTTSYDHLGNARNWMSHVCGPHELAQRGHTPLSFHHEAIRFPGFGTVIGRIGYGTDVTINVQRDACFNVFSLSLPCMGTQRLRSPGGCHVSTQQRGIAIMPGVEQTLDIEENCQKLQVVIPLAGLQHVAETLMHRRLRLPVMLDPEMDLRHPAIAAWWQMVSQTLENWERTGPFWQLQGLANDFEQTLIKGLLIAQSNWCTGDALTKTNEDTPVALQKVELYLSLHLREDIGLAKLEEASGVSRQKLYDIFHDFHGCTPIAYVKRRRLEGVRRMILDTPQSCQTITIVAMHWGFNHLGRFARDYMEAFGESPSRTLQLARSQRKHQKSYQERLES